MHVLRSMWNVDIHIAAVVVDAGKKHSIRYNIAAHLIRIIIYAKMCFCIRIFNTKSVEI